MKTPFKHILFDLDDTLYPRSSGLQNEIRRRIMDFSADYLNMELEKFKALRKERFHLYGTTLKWIESEFDFRDREAYLEYSHPENLSDFISPDPALISLLERIETPCSVFTNSPMEHAERVTRFLGIRDFFRDIYDIRFHEFHGKPHADCYTRVLSRLNCSPEDILFLDDSPMYLEGFSAQGGHVLLIDEMDQYNGFLPKVKRASDLESFLEKITA